jgi:hypothetical protein
LVHHATFRVVVHEAQLRLLLLFVARLVCSRFFVAPFVFASLIIAGRKRVVELCGVALGRCVVANTQAVASDKANLEHRSGRRRHITLVLERSHFEGAAGFRTVR